MAQKKKLIQHWTRDALDDYTQRTGTPETHVPNLITTRFLENLLKTSRFHTIVEFGCGDGALAHYFADHLPAKQVIATDIPNPRIEEAKRVYADHPRLSFHGLDLMQTQKRFQADGVIFVSTSVLGNIVPREVQRFFKGIRKDDCAVVSSARSLHEGKLYELRSNNLKYEYNFDLLFKKYGLNLLEGHWVHEHKLVFSVSARPVTLEPGDQE